MVWNTDKRCALTTPGSKNIMRTKWLQWILVYGLWIITAGLGFLCLTSARNLCISILYAFSANMWVAPAIDKFTFLALGILWLILVIFTESYYREALLKKILWKHFSLITTIELLFLGVAHLIPILIMSKSKGLYWSSLLLPAIELIGGVVFFEQYKFRKLH